MINFRCWFCNKAYSVADARAGEVRVCACGRRVRVPKRSGGSSRSRTALDALVEFIVYGVGTAALCFALTFLVVPRIPMTRTYRLMIIGGATLVGLLAGGLGGEPVVNWVGRKIRDREER